MGVPLLYLVIRALDAEPATLQAILLQPRNVVLFVNTILLTVAVIIGSLMIAMPLAWLTTRCDIHGRRLFSVLGMFPLAMPAYLMAYCYIALSGSYGSFAQVFSITLPRLGGFWGAALVLSACNYPYLYLNLRSAMLGLDPSLEEVAKSLGQSRWNTLWRVILPQLLPACYSGFLLTGLHVLNDFGAVSLMGYETFSYAIYRQYMAGFDRTYAAWLALMLIALTGLVLLLEGYLLRKSRFDRTTAVGSRRARRVQLGKWKIPGYAFLVGQVFCFVVLPLFTLIFWGLQGDSWSVWPRLLEAAWGSTRASAPAAVAATCLALPLVYWSLRAPSRLTRFMERAAYMGYAVPSLAFALALIFFTLNVIPVLYQSMIILVFAYTMRFVAEAVGPIRSALYQTSPRLEEAGRILGYGWTSVFFFVTLPLLRNGILISLAFVFVSAMKELPLTFLLSPLGFRSLAVDLWGLVDEALFAQAAPYAITILTISAVFTSMLLLRETRQE